MSIVLATKSGPDGTLHLDIPVGSPDADYEVEVVVRRIPATGKDWPAGYAELFNSVEDDSFDVPAQPPMPPAVGME